MTDRRENIGVLNVPLYHSLAKQVTKPYARNGLVARESSFTPGDACKPVPSAWPGPHCTLTYVRGAQGGGFRGWLGLLRPRLAGYVGSMPTKGSVAQRLAVVQGRGTLRLTTRGRKTGRPHTVTIWFLVDGATVYLVTMSLRRDWPRNLLQNGYAELDIDASVFGGHATPVKDAKRLERVRELLNQKYWVAWLGSWFGFGPDGAFAVTIRS